MKNSTVTLQTPPGLLPLSVARVFERRGRLLGLTHAAKIEGGEKWASLSRLSAYSAQAARYALDRVLALNWWPYRFGSSLLCSNQRRATGPFTEEFDPEKKAASTHDVGSESLYFGLYPFFDERLLSS